MTPVTYPVSGSFPFAVTNSDSANVPDGDWTITAQALVSNVWQNPVSLSFDAGFGAGSNSGKAAAAPSGVGTGYGVAVQPDGKIVVAGAKSSNAFGITRHNPAGSLDLTFGDRSGGQHTGTATTTFGGTSSTAYAVALQPDSRIVAAGVSGGKFALARYNPTDGTLDTTLAGTGTVTLSGVSGQANAVAIQPDGRIVLAGVSGSKMTAVRLNINGSLDYSFGTNGVATVTVPNTANSTANAVLLQQLSTGLDVLLGGTALATNLGCTGCCGTCTTEVTLVRLTPAGVVDSAFGTSGYATVNTGCYASCHHPINNCCGSGHTSQDNGYSLAFDSGGNILFSGNTDYASPGSPEFLVGRYTASGVLDTTFGYYGLNVSGIGSAAYNVQARPANDGRIVLTGGTSAFAFAAFTSSGLVDTTFANSGTLSARFDTGTDGAYAAALQPDGRLVAAGVASSALAVVRLLPFSQIHAQTELPPEIGFTQIPMDITVDTPLRGIISDPNHNLTSWTLEAIPSSGDAPVVLASGNEATEQGWYNDISTASFDAQIAVIRPTLLPQGTYTLELTATDPSNQTPQIVSGTTTSQLIQIETQLRAGSLNLPFTDLTIPAAGLPMTVSRVYDGANPNKDDNDFGPGWRMEMPDVNLRTTAYANGSFDSQAHPAFQSGDEVFITLPGGQTDVFAFDPQHCPGTQQFDTEYMPAFDDVSGSHAILSVDINGIFDGNSNLTGWYLSTEGTPGWYEFNSQVGYNPNLSQFGGYYDLKTPDGTDYRINAVTDKVLTETDRNQNVVDFSNYFLTSGGTITQSNPNVAGSTLTLQVKRGVTMSDNSVRNYIYEIDDPEGHAILYSYDTNVNDVGAGDLLSVRDRSSNTTTYVYDPTTNLMTDVKDPRNLDVMHAEYVGTTLVRIDDVYGQASAINSEPAVSDGNGGTTQVQQTVDLAGNLVEDTYNTFGNLIREAKRMIVNGTPQWSVTVFQNTYSGADLVERQISVPFFASDSTRATAQPTAWAKIDTYDASGNVSTETVGQDVSYSVNGTGDPGWMTTYIGYNGFAEAGEIDNPAGGRTYYLYDGNGNLLTTFNQAAADIPPDQGGTVQRDRVDYTYDTRGEVLTVNKWNYLDASGNPTSTLTEHVVTTNTYNGPFGRLDTTTDNVTGVTGVKHTYAYDGNGGNGNVSSDTYTWTGPGNVSWTVEADTTYDNSDRVLTSTSDKVYQTANHSIFYGTGPQFYTGVTTQATYNSIGKIATTTDEYGRQTTYTYDAHGNLIQTQFPDGTYTRTVYDTLNRPIWVVDQYKPGSPDAGANGTNYTYDELGRVVEEDRYTAVLIAVGNDLKLPGSGVQASSQTHGTKFSSAMTAYGGDGNVSSVTGTDVKTTSYTYDNEGRVSTVSNALNQITYYYYYHNDSQNQSSTFRRYDVVTDPLGKSTTTDYDYLNRVTKITYPDNTTTQTLYGYNGAVVPNYSVPGQTKIFGNQVVKIDQRNIATNSFYDLDGRLTDVWQPQVADALNNNTLTSPHWQYTYDANGNLSVIQDPKTHQTTLTYDPLARQIGRTLPHGEQESQSYDTFGRPWVHTDFAGNTATNTYVGTSDVPHEGLLASVQYVGTGKPTETVQYTYDALDRKTQSTDTIGSTVITTNYGYDESGGYQLNGSSLSGDVDGLLTSVTTAISGGMTVEVHYVYDAATQRLIETWTGTGAITAATTDTLYGYDALGRLESVTVQKQNGATPTQTTSNTTRYGPTGAAISTTLPTTVYSYDSVGRPLIILYPNGTETDYNWSNYWATSNPTEVVTNKRGTTTLSTFTYTFDAARRKVLDTETVLNVNEGSSVTATYTWAYDDLNRLTSEQFSDGTTADAYKSTYSYDLAGNRYQKKSYLGANVNGSTPDHTYTDTYNNDDQLTQELDQLSGGATNTTTTYGYDPNGSTTSKVVKNSSNQVIETDTYVYDARNRMISATVAGTASSDTYNDDGDRIKETAGSTTSTFLVDANNPTGYSQVLETWQGGTNPAVTYTLGSAVIAQNSAGTVSYLMPDGHGSTRQLTAYTTDSTNGHVTGRYDFDAFGNQVPLSGLPANAATTVILYTGQPFDSALGQYYLRARYYSPAIGRFTGSDSQRAPEDLGNANLYMYVGGNPISLTDGSGRDDLSTINVSNGIRLAVASILLISTAVLYQQVHQVHLNITLPTVGLGVLATEEARGQAEAVADHALVPGGHGEDFPDWTKDSNGNPIREHVIDYIEGVIQQAEDGVSDVITGVDPSDGTKALWDTAEGIIVILGGPTRPGTAFKPQGGKSYFDQNFPGRPGR